MRKLLLLLMAAHLLLGAAWGTVDKPAPAPQTPPASAPAPERRDGLYELLERLWAQYDPAAAGSVGAVLWAEKLMDAYVDGGADPSAAASAAAGFAREHPDTGLADTMPRLRAAAERLASGAEQGLIRDGSHRGNAPWTREEVKALFDALQTGLAG